MTSIGSSAFYGCSGLTSFTIPSSVTSIAVDAFRGCGNLSSITVDNSNTVYDSRDNCNAIIKKTTNELIIGCKGTVIANTRKTHRRRRKERQGKIEDADRLPRYTAHHPGKDIRRKRGFPQKMAWRESLPRKDSLTHRRCPATRSPNGRTMGLRLYRC